MGWSGEAFTPPKIRSLHPTQLPGMSLKTSTRWFRNWKDFTKVQPIQIPFILPSGKISTRKLATWTCFPEQAVASVASTVYHRLLKILRKRLTERSIKSRDYSICFRIAVYYSITHSDYFLDRALALLGRSRKIAKVISCFISKLSDKLWFVYRQVCLQTSWLTSRSKWISDKLRVKEISRDLIVKASKSPEYNKSDQTPFAPCALFFKNNVEARAVPYVTTSLRHVSDVRGGRGLIGTSLDIKGFELFDISDGEEW
jgi:hypothetical protein